MIGKITTYAPAKINLTLEVTGKRDDGYHTISSIMQSISLYDKVSTELNDSGKISVECDNENIPSGKENIAYRAAEAFFLYSGIRSQGVSINIDKKIPSQAGLGGGSADAAAVLCAMNKLLKTEYSAEKLCEIGVTVGADVPFCIVGGTKLCCGIGEIISEAPVLENCHIVIGKGLDGISTKEAFEKIDSIGFCECTIPQSYDGTIKSVAYIGRNVFEEVSDLESVSEIKKIFLSSGAEYSAMSGSGSAVFGIFSDIGKADKCRKMVAENGFFSALCHPVPCGTCMNVPYMKFRL